MVASILTPGDVLAIPKVAKRLAPLTRDFAQSFGNIHRLQATGAEIIASGIDEGSMSFPAVISTADIDRVGDILLPEGCDLTAYRNNPLVFVNHDAESIPLGRSEGPDGRLYVAVEPTRVLARCFCIQGGKYGQDAADIFHIIVQGGFNDVSVGFNPHPDPRYTQQLDTGGKRYEVWELLEWSAVGIGCNRAAKIIRKFLTDGRITGKRISPQLTKMLTPLAEPAPVWSPGGFAPNAAAASQSTPETENTPPGGDDPMSKRWKKAAPKKKDGMSETSGTAGGYGTTMPKPEPAGEHERIKGEIAAVMEKHKGGDPDYHHAYYKAETGEVHHTVGDAAEEGHAERVKADLEAIDGVNAVHQGDEHGPAEGEGYEKVYPPMEAKPEEKAARLAHQKTMRLIRRKAQTAYHIGRGKSLMQLRHLLDPKKKDALEACVHRKIPILMDEGHEQTQAEAIAFSVCGESKGMLDEDDYEHKDDMDGDADDANPMGPGDADDATQEGVPDGLELCQQEIENIESRIPTLEPERREFWEGIVAQIREHGEATYPGEDLGGGQEETGLGEETAQEAEDEEETEELLSGYKARQAARKKALQAARKKSLEDLASGDHHKMLKKSADLHHEIGKMEEGTPITKRLKAMHSDMGRGMDGLHAIVTHNMPPEEVKDVSSQEGEKPDEMALEPTPAGESHEDMEMKSAGVDWSAVMRRLDGVAEQAKTNQDAFYSVTGKR